jgi:phosphate transport system substrate-binding protein
VALGESGSAEAIRRLCAGEAEMATVSRPIVKAELARCQQADASFVELPIAFDAIVVVVNPRNAFVGALSVEELKAIWSAQAQAKVTRWSQVNAKYPDTAIKLYAPEPRAERGNTFNEAILGAGGEPRRDVTGSADDGVLVEALARDANALGYVPLAYYLANRNRLKAVPIAASAGAQAVTPSADSIAKGEYQPLSRPLFLYVNAKALERTQVKALAEFYLREARRLARELNYVPLAESTYELAQARLRQKITGSPWGGSVPVGLTLEAVHKRLAL